MVVVSANMSCETRLDFEKQLLENQDFDDPADMDKARKYRRAIMGLLASPSHQEDEHNQTRWNTGWLQAEHQRVRNFIRNRSTSRSTVLRAHVPWRCG